MTESRTGEVCQKANLSVRLAVFSSCGAGRLKPAPSLARAAARLASSKKSAPTIRPSVKRMQKRELPPCVSKPSCDAPVSYGRRTVLSCPTGAPASIERTTFGVTSHVARTSSAMSPGCRWLEPGCGRCLLDQASQGFAPRMLHKLARLLPTCSRTRPVSSARYRASSSARGLEARGVERDVCLYSIFGIDLCDADDLSPECLGRGWSRPE